MALSSEAGTPPYPIDPRAGRGRGAFRRLPPPEQRGGRLLWSQVSGADGAAGRSATAQDGRRNGGARGSNTRSLSPNRARERRRAAGRRAWLDGAPSDRADRAEAEARRERALEQGPRRAVAQRRRARPFMSRRRYFAGRDDNAWYAGFEGAVTGHRAERRHRGEQLVQARRRRAPRSRFPPSGEYPHF